MKNSNHSQLDVPQIQKRMFDEDNDSQRVTIVSGVVPDITVNVDASTITDAIKAGLVQLNPGGLTPHYVQPTTRTIEIPFPVKEVVFQEIPVIVKEIEYKEIKIPYEVIKIIEIEKPIITREVHLVEKSTTETKYLRIICIVLFITQLISLLMRLK